MEIRYAQCPHCSGGRKIDLHVMAMVECPDCYGKGFVIANHICACGRPCRILSADKILYCGEKTCHGMLLGDKNEAEREKRIAQAEKMVEERLQRSMNSSIVRGWREDFHQRGDTTFLPSRGDDPGWWPGYGHLADA